MKLLRSALGSAAVARPNINLDALGFGFANESDFLKLARVFRGYRRIGIRRGGVPAFAGGDHDSRTDPGR